MRILHNETWQSGYLDYSCLPDTIRVEPYLWLNVSVVDSQYFVREKNLRLVYNYIVEIGLVATLRKILSRRAESARNEKFLSIGVGKVVECAPGAEDYEAGDIVTFIAPNHPRCVERVVINRGLAVDCQLQDFNPDEQSVRYLPLDPTAEVPISLKQLGGWSEFSGNPLDISATELNDELHRRLKSAQWQNARSLPKDIVINTRKAASSPPKHTNRRLSAALYGYGNYAKTMILPNIGDYLSVDTVHEIDPTQLPLALAENITWDSSPFPAREDRQDVLLIAGYHHTHAALAVQALSTGAAAVVEKPVVTTAAQFEEVRVAMQKSPGKLYSGYHKRYGIFNEWARQDLDIANGDPVSYHCIVFEVPLPDLHWYRWPNSCSRVLSNGCHWIDHFLFLNDFAAPLSCDIYKAADGAINCSVELKNGAFFTMVLTDLGSDRLGVQNHVELRKGKKSARIFNDSSYFSESGNRVLRKKSVNRTDSYKRMYGTIAKNIAAGEAGDTLKAFTVSAGLILEIERLLKEIDP